MQSLKTLFCISILSLLISPSYAATTQFLPSGCCSQMGGISYCDSSAGRLVCKNGFYSTCYCTPHAVMDLNLFRGCCLWKGGVVSTYSITGFVVCNDGSVSEECSLRPEEKIAAW
ncbi:TPA: neurogenic locus notch [Legionella bozemanae]